MRRKIDWPCLAPLLLLLLIPLGIGPVLDGGHKGVYALRYVAIPLAGFAIGFSLFLAAARGHLAPVFLFEDALARKRQRVFLILFFSFLLGFLILIGLRYGSVHLGVIDFGVYDFTIWKISMAPWAQKFHASTFDIGHFKPVLVLYSFLYDLGAPPVTIELLQAAAVASGAVPLYLTAARRLENRFLPIGVVFIYLIYPPVEFNAVKDFYPDNLFIPLMLWALYFLDRDRVGAALPFLLAASALKEPLIAGVAFTGLYLILKKKRYLEGALVFLIFIAAFYLVTFRYIPGTGANGVMGSSAYSYMASDGILPAIKEAIRPEKMRFPYFLLFPLLLLPLLSPVELLGAIPAVAIVLLSSNPHHQNAASHYTAGVIPFAFFAFVNALRIIEKRFDRKKVSGVFLWVAALTVSFNIAHSPSPLAVAFWDKDWSYGVWHYSNYIKTDHERALEEAAALVPGDPAVKVVSHSRVYAGNLAHRDFYKSFPDGWQEADYIVLDGSRGPYVIDNFDEKGYEAAVEAVRKDGAVELVFEKDGVSVFRRRAGTGGER